MRTKVLLGAAALVAAATTSMAQNVYSLNVVGYINLSLTNGYNLIANQLDLDGTGTNNTLLTTLSTNLPNKSAVFSWSTSAQTFNKAVYNAGTGVWGSDTTDVNAALQPGGGVFVQIPATAATPLTVTLVGQVLQGTNTLSLVAGLNMVSIIPPISGGIVSAMGYTPTKKEYVLLWDPINQIYGTKTQFTGTGWNNGEPTPAVGQAFFLNTVAATNWVQGFTVQ
jgi:hypothetical protein